MKGNQPTLVALGFANVEAVRCEVAESKRQRLRDSQSGCGEQPQQRRERLAVRDVPTGDRDQRGDMRLREDKRLWATKRIRREHTIGRNLGRGSSAWRCRARSATFR